MTGWLDGKVALITGGGSGLGSALVERFVAEGANVGVLERDPDRVEALCAKFGDRIAAVIGDVVNPDDNHAAVAATLQRFGRLDTLIANAGIFDFFASVAETDAEALSAGFDEIFAVNVKGVMLAAKAALPSLIETRGNIVVTLSSASFYAGGGGVLYTMSKHALRGLVKQLAHELAPKVRVNGVAPGAMRTQLSGLHASGTENVRLGDRPGFDDTVIGITPLRIAADPADHTGAYVLLASNEQSRAITGEVIRTDGGLGTRGIRQLVGGEDL